MCALLKFIKVFCIVLHILTTLLIHCSAHSMLVCITQSVFLHTLLYLVRENSKTNVL